MFSIDFPEIVIILGLALVVLGPKKLPVAAAKIGRWVGRARTMARQFREQLEQEIQTTQNSIDIRKSIDSADTPTQGAAPHAAPPESVPHEAVAHGSTAHEPAAEPAPHTPTPYESGLYGMPPAEGYGPSPEQLTFDAQLHDTALPPEGAHPGDARDWMPETQTWMASAAWEKPEPAPEGAPPSHGEAPQASASTPSSAAPERASPPERTPGPAAATPSSRPEAVEHHDR